MENNNNRFMQGVGLTKHGTNKSSGIYTDSTSFECASDGSLDFIWKEGEPAQNVSFILGQAFPHNAFSIEIKSGKFHIGF